MTALRMETPTPPAMTLLTSLTQGDSDGSMQTHPCDSCDFVGSSHAELLIHQKSHLHHPSTDNTEVVPSNSEPGQHDDSNNNTKQKRRDATSDCSDMSEDDASMSSLGDTTIKNTYTCNSCELTVSSEKTYLHHLVEQHGHVFDIFECDLCEYATRCQQNLTHHRKCHFTSDMSPQTDITSLQETSADDGNKKIATMVMKDSEGCDTQDNISIEQKPEMSTQDAAENKEMCIVSPRGSPGNQAESDQTKDQLTIKADDTELMKLHKIAMSMKSADCKSHVSQMNRETLSTDAASCATQSPSAEIYFQAAAAAAMVEDKQLGPNTYVQQDRQNLAVKLMSKETLPGANNGVKRRMYTPVREAVDPGKYMIIHEIDGTKYACSKCGNIYKWRKSLNKHWKEKHDGQTPDVSIAAAHYGIPSAKAEKKRVSASPMHFSPLSSSNSNKKLPASSPNSRALKQMELQSHHFGSNNFQTSRNTPMMLSSSLSTSHKRPASLVDAYAGGYIKRACSYNRKSPVPLPARSLAASPADMRAMSTGYGYYSDSPSVVTPKPLYINHHKGKPVMKSSPPPPLPTPPTAHTHYMCSSTLGMLADIPVDLSSQCSSVYSDNSEESVLDLSKDSTCSILKLSSNQLPPPQDEPLDFSARSDPGIVSVKREDRAAPGQCSVCAYVSKSSTDYAEHMAIHNLKKNHRCATCQQPFLSISGLNEHFQQHHLDVLNADITQFGLVCAEEGKDDPFKQTEKTQLFKYLTKRETEPILSFCVVCGMKFEGQTSLAEHFEQTHTSLASPYRRYLSPQPCTPVGVKLEIDACSDAKQQRILFDVEEHQPALLQCSQCVFVAQTTSELARHQLKHSLSMTLACRICSCSCQSKNELFLHYQKQHADVTVRHPQDLQLDVHCGLEVDHSEGHQTSAAMDSLTQIVDGDTVIDLTADGTVVVIPQAPEETSSSPMPTKSSFGRLSKKYAGLATGNSPASAEMLLPYKCSVCEYRARWPSEITQHMKNHSDEKPYSCPRCTYKSKWKWDVVKHLKRCGGGTVKDVIDNTRRKKHPHMLTLLPDKELPKLSPEGVGPTNREVLSSGPPNVTVQQKGDSSAKEAEVSAVQCMKESSSPSKPEDLAMSPAEKTRQIQSQLYCQKCPFIGNSPAELKRHSRVHSEEKPFICKTCGYCSKWKCDLKKHLRAYNHTPAVPLVYGGHGRKPGEWYNNKMISKMTAATSDTEHSTSTEESQPIDNHASSVFLPAVYRCSKCPYITSKKHLLESHVKVHSRIVTSNLGKFKCKKCDFEAEDLPGFLQHKITHSTQHLDRHNATWADMGRKPAKMPRSGIQQNDGVNSNDYMELSDDSSISDDHNAAEDSYGSDTDCEARGENTDHRQIILPLEERSPRKSVHYRCVHCTYKTHNRVDFEKHIPVHVASGSHDCQWCSWTTNSLNLLYQHAQQAHSLELEEQDKEPLQAEEDEEMGEKHDASTEDKQAKDEAQTADSVHESNVAEDQTEVSGASNDGGGVVKAESGTKRRKLKTCNQCGYITDNLTTLQRHTSKHGSGGKYPCDFCDYSVDRQHVVLYHMRTVHSHIQGISSTEDTHESCTKLAEDQATDILKQSKEEDWDTYEKGPPEGIHVFREAGKTFYACKKCKYATGNISNAHNHAKPHGAHKRYTCEYCDYSLDQLRHIIHHMKTCHVQVDDYSQKDKAQLNASKLHQLAVFQCIPVRVNRKVNFRCLTCAAASHSKQRMLKHIISQHAVSHKHTCRQCSYKATTASLQRKHFLKRHPKANPPKKTTAPQSDHKQGNRFNKDNAKKTGCMICPFQSSSTAELKVHLDHHGMALPFQCDLCNYSHQQLSKIYQHRKLHKDDASFKTSVSAKLLINTSLFAVGNAAENVTATEETCSGADDAVAIAPKGLKFTCPHCPYRCGSLKNYKVHMELHSANRKFRCDYCDWSVDRFNLLYSHRYRLHSAEPNFNLNRDSAELANAGYQQAMKTEDMHQTCPFCPYTSDSSDVLRQHQLRHQVKSRYTCDICSFSVDELLLLQYHQKLHRHKGNKHNECSKCPYRTHSHALLEMHARMHGAVNKYMCEYCDYSVNRYNLLGQHMRVHGAKSARYNNNHSTKANKGTVPRNQHSTSSNDRLIVHGSDNEAELLTCDRCPYQACSLTNLAQHSLGHSTKAKHSCPYCDFASTTMMQLVAHINLHFPGTRLDLQEIRQLVTNNGYTSNDEKVPEAVADMTEEPDENEPMSDGMCHFCDRSFSDTADLQQHKQMHLIGGGTC